MRVVSGTKSSGSPPYSSLLATTISGEPSPSRSPTAGEPTSFAARSLASTPSFGVARPVAGSTSTCAGSAMRTGKPGRGVPSWFQT